MSQPVEPGSNQPQVPQPWNQVPITEVSAEDWIAPAPAYLPPPPYAAPGYQSATGELRLDGGSVGYAPDWPPVTMAPPPARRRTLPWVLGAAAAVVVLAAGGLSYTAYAKLNGGGVQPDAVTPAGAIGFVKLDLNPSASQKIAAARFLGKLPKGGAGFSSTGDWRKAAFDLVSSSGDFPSDVNFDRDVKPWLGQRMAVAALPSGDSAEPAPLLVVQSTDDAKAKAGVAHFDPNAGIDFYKGYALVAESQAKADQALAAAKQANLAGSAQYGTDLKAIGSLGVVSGWLNLSELSKLGGNSTGPFGSLADTGRLAFTVRFSSGSADLTARTFGTPGGRSVATQAAAALGALPASTAAALNVSIAPGTVDKAWEQASGSLSAGLGAQAGGEEFPQVLADEFGLNLPSDLDTLLGRNLTLAVDGNGLAGQDNVPSIGIITQGDGPAAGDVLKKVAAATAQFGGGQPFVYRTSPTGVAAATNQSYLDELGQASGPTLGNTAAFRAALPDLAGATAAGYLNFDLIAAAMRQSGASADDLRVISGFSALGFTVNADGSIHVRLLAR